MVYVLGVDDIENPETSSVAYFWNKIKNYGSGHYVELTPTKIIEENTDLNNVIDYGTYYVSDDISQTLSNCPTDTEFILEIGHTSSDDIVFQKINLCNDGSFYYRVKEDINTWGSWHQSAQTSGILNKNLVLASPPESSGYPTYRNLVQEDIPNLPASRITSGSFNSDQIPDLPASKIASGILPVSRGGTGKSTQILNSILVGNGTSEIKNIPTANGAFYATSSNGEALFGVLPIEQGGTGATTKAEILESIEAAPLSHVHEASHITSGTLGVARGGTGMSTHTVNAVLTGGNGTAAIKDVVTADGAFYATSSNGAPTFGTLPIAQGGTGATTKAAALTNLGAASASHTHAASDIASGTFASSRIPELPASKITSGTFSSDRIPDLSSTYAKASHTHGYIQNTYKQLITTSGNIRVDDSSGNIYAYAPLTSAAPSGSAQQAANKVFATPNGSSGLPSMRSLVSDDLPNINAAKITAGTLDAARIPNLNTSKLTAGTLGVARGGTGVATHTVNAVITGGDGTEALKDVKTANGAFYATAANGAAKFGTLPVAQGGTGLTASPSMLVNLGSTSAANVLAASPRPGITGTLSVAHGGTGKTGGICLMAYSLYHSESGTLNTVNLSTSTAIGTLPGNDSKMLEIFFIDNDGNRGSVRVLGPRGLSGTLDGLAGHVTLSTCSATTSETMYLKTRRITVASSQLINAGINNTLTQSYNEASINSDNSVTVSNTNHIYITDVIGYL